METVNLNISDELKEAIKIVKLDEKIIERVSKDEGVNQIAFLILALSSIAASLSTFMIPNDFININLDFTALNFIKFAVFDFVLAIMYIYTMAFIAEKIFKGPANTHGFFRSIAYGSIIKIANLIPVFGLLAGVWYLVIQFKILKKIFKLQFHTAILTMIIGIITIGLLGSILNQFGFNILDANNLE